ncbi:MAG: DUF1622 domain-containing protein [Chloroflexi bacterium]|nr:DUF1622 domain-containing protein [Chloroflexota bacterium]MBP7044237.1 DUF1622 domain-containing protein [Chloroflexota bacterium]
MLPSIISKGETGDTFLLWVEYATLFIEALAVLTIVVAIVVALTSYLLRYARQPADKENLYHALKVSLGKSLLLGLEILVAADIIHTVALEATLESVLVLGLLVVIRTFLSWALLVEIEGRWPWQHV